MDNSSDRRRRALRNQKLGLDRVDLGEPDPSLQRRSKEKAGDQEVTLSLPTSWDYLKAWFSRYVVGHPIAGVSSLTFRSRQTHALMIGMKFKAIIEGAYQGEIVLPLFEFSVLVDDAICRVTPCCNEPDLIGYFRGLLLAIAEKWPEVREVVSRYVARLPETHAIEPSFHVIHTEAEQPTTPKSYEIEQPTEPPQAKRDADAPKKPRVPGRLRDLNKWRACWRKIKPEWRRGKEYYEIREWLNVQDSSLEYSEDVLAEIIKAGEAGLLDQDSPDISR